MYHYGVLNTSVKVHGTISVLHRHKKETKMKRTKSVIAMIMAAVLCFASVYPAAGAETADNGATIVDETAMVEEDIVVERDEVPEVGPIIEKDQSEKNTEPKLAVQGSVNGDSKVTWTKNTMPAVFDTTGHHSRKRAYLTAVQDGYMRVAYNGESIVVEYYDDGFQMTRQGVLSKELDEWGGFYKGEDAYYIVEGQLNTDCIDGTEVVRIIKYDFNWNRIGAGRILAEEGWEYEIRFPFNYSCVNMCEVNGKLYITTGRQGYVDASVGQGHQGMMLIRMDEETFETEIVYGDFWHSFAQYVDHNGTDLYICEQSEGSFRTSLSRFDTNRTGTDHYNAFSERFSVLDYGIPDGSVEFASCYASVDDMAISADNVLCLGTSIDQAQYDNVASGRSYPTYNVYLTVTPISNLNSSQTTVKWLTDYASGGKSFFGANITKVDNDRFLIVWEETPGENDSFKASDNRDPLSSGQLHYVFVDGAGKKISKEFTAHAMGSECKPVLKGNKIVYYASNANCQDFYTIDAQTGKFSKSTTRIAGDNASWDYKEGVLSFSGKGDISVDLKGRYRFALTGDPYLCADSCWEELHDYVTDIKIGKGITSIPENAFNLFNKLTKVILPEGLKSIGKRAFFSCLALKEISIPYSVNEIGDDFLWTGYSYVPSGSQVIYAKIIGYCTSYAIEYAKKNNISYSIKHKWDTKTTKATTEKNGKIVKKCSLCGEAASEEVIYYPKTVKLSNTPLMYNGKVQKPEVIIKGSDGKVISADNYTLTYSGGCKEIGSYSVKIEFKGNYSGSLTKKFRIVLGKTGRGDMFNLANNVKVTWKAVPGARYYKVYREGVTDPGESQAEPVIVTTGLIGWDKQPGLTNGHAYRYKIVASLTGKGDDSKDSPLSYSKLMYRLKTVVLRSVKNTGPGEVTVKYDKTTSGDSYVLQYSENEDMTDAKTKVVLGASNTSYVIGGLKKGKTYYVSIRVRKKVNGIDYYTTFGVPKKVTISK